MVTCDKCGAECVPTLGTTGYGTDDAGRKHCLACCADQDRDWMDTHSRTTLYLEGQEVTNWPGTMRFNVTWQRKGRHNMAGVRYDIRFLDHHGREWAGTQYGDNTQIVHCRKLARR